MGNPPISGPLPPAPPPSGPPAGAGQLPPAPSAPPYPPPVRSRRRSIFPGLLLIIVGLLLLVARFHPGISLGYVITHFWPIIIIVWGASKLIDRYSQPEGVPPASMLTAGEIALIIVLVLLVMLVAFIGWVHNRRRDDLNFALFGRQHYTQTHNVDVKTVQPNSTFAITTQNGAINVHSGGDDALRVVGTASAPGDTEQAARDRMKNLDVVFDGSNGNYQIHPVNDTAGGVSVDLDVQLPKASTVTARSQRGDITVADLQGGADVATHNGDLQVHDIGANVTADLDNGDAHIRNVNGAVNFTGRGGGDVDITDVQGAVNIGGNVFGDVDVRNVPKGVHYTSPRANVQVASAPGEVKIDNSDIEVSRATGPITINAKNQDVRLNDVQGPLDLNETHGDIYVTFTEPPKAPINISSDSGDVTLNLPPQSAFTVFAQSNAGDVTDDFAANPNHDDDRGPHHDQATYGSGGPMIHVTTKYGDIHIGNSQ